MRIAFRMRVNPRQVAEYEKRHNPIWPDLESTLKSHGVTSYSIFLDPQSGDLFAYAEIDDLDRWEAVARTEICQKWWAYMQPLMPTHADGRPESTSLREVFHIEQ